MAQELFAELKIYVNKNCKHEFVQLSSCRPNQCIYCGVITKEVYNSVKKKAFAKIPELNN